MSHPLSDDFKNLSDTELLKKHDDLTKKYWMSTNEQVKDQIVMLLDDVRLEQESRRFAQKKQEEDKNNLDNLINIS
tara:strand:- start:185 stop:412 length:228 start_codon:yes stop_codon:yes gene_type:complete